jgi:hypothetical protein
VSSADQWFIEILKGLRPVLAQNGFRKSSQNFVLESPECWAVINLQKSRWSAPDEKTFYVNVGVTAKRLLLFRHERIDKPPAHWKCAWNVRAEGLAPEPTIQQWTVRDENSVRETLEYLYVLISQFVIPRVRGMLSEADLLKIWADDRRLGYPLLKAKSILLAAQGNAEDLGRTLHRLRDEFGSGIVAEGVAHHIASLQREFPETMRRVEFQTDEKS